MNKKHTVPVTILTSETSHGGGICEGDEDSSWPSHETVYYEVTIKGCFVGKVPSGWLNYSREIVEVPRSLIENMKFHYFLVPVVTYSDGDTFGSSSGHKAFLGAFTEMKDAQHCLDHKDDEEGCKAWTGYFNRVENCCVEIVNILGIDLNE